MCKKKNFFKVLFVVLISGLLILGIQGSKVEAQTATNPTFSYLPFMGGMMGMFNPYLYSSLGSLDTSSLGFGYPFMGGMMGMGGFMGGFGRYPWQYSNLDSLDTSSLGFGYPYMGGMMGRFNPYLYSSLDSLDTSSLGFGYPYMGGMMGMGGFMGGFGRYPWQYSSLDTSSLSYFPYMGMGMMGMGMPFFYNSLFGNTTTTTTPTI
jgi:hypothetical protein